VHGGLDEGFLRIVGYDETPEAAREADLIRRPVLFLQLGNIAIVDVPVRPGTVNPSPKRTARRNDAGVKPPTRSADEVSGWVPASP
jgi:hypothetical protein